MGIYVKTAEGWEPIRDTRTPPMPSSVKSYNAAFALSNERIIENACHNKTPEQVAEIVTEYRAYFARERDRFESTPGHIGFQA